MRPGRRVMRRPRISSPFAMTAGLIRRRALRWSPSIIFRRPRPSVVQRSFRRRWWGGVTGRPPRISGPNSSLRAPCNRPTGPWRRHRCAACSSLRQVRFHETEPQAKVTLQSVPGPISTELLGESFRDVIQLTQLDLLHILGEIPVRHELKNHCQHNYHHERREHKRGEKLEKQLESHTVSSDAPSSHARIMRRMMVERVPLI